MVVTLRVIAYLPRTLRFLVLAPASASLRRGLAEEAPCHDGEFKAMPKP
jgi:hypothetical protein